MRRRTTLLWAAALVVTSIAPWNSSASAATPGRFVSGWIPNWSSSVVTDGIRGLNSGADQVFADISPFGFSAISAATIVISGSETNLSTSVNAARARNLPVLPSITDGTGKLVMAGILANPATRTQHVQAITNLVLARNYDGIDLDYEGFAFSDGRSTWAATRPNWAAFIAELGASLHANGRLLAVTVPPIWDNGNSGYTVYAWPEMLPHIDRLRLMVYDWSVGSAGPVSPMSWVNNVLSYVATVVPANQLSKVQMGVPTYGRSWATVISGSCPANASTATLSVQMENVGPLVAKPGAVVTRDPSGEMKIVYNDVFTGSGTSATPPTYVPPANRPNTVAAADPSGLRTALRLGGATCTVRRTVYYPDEFTVVEHANAALDAGLSGIVIWALGYETTTTWAPLLGMSIDRPAGTAPIGSLDAVTIVGDSVAVSGWVLDPEFDLPTTFSISVTNPGQQLQMSGMIIARDLRADVSTAIQFADPLHGFSAGVSIPTVSGATVCLHATGWGLAATSTVIQCRAA